MSVYYTVALVALISAVVFTLLAVTLFFTWNIRKLRRDVKGISLRSKIVDSASASVDSYIQMTEAHGEDLGTLDTLSSGNLDTPASRLLLRLRALRRSLHLFPPPRVLLLSRNPPSPPPHPRVLRTLPTLTSRNPLLPFSLKRTIPMKSLERRCWMRLRALMRTRTRF